MIKNTKNLNEKKIFKEYFSLPRIQGVIIDLNTEEQLFTLHIDSAGEFLKNADTGSEFYQPNTRKRSTGRKVGGQRFDLLDFGDFYRSWRVSIKGTDIIISSNTLVDEDQDLEDIFGDKIVGLTDESLIKLINLFRNELIKIVRFEILK